MMRNAYFRHALRRIAALAVLALVAQAAVADLAVPPFTAAYTVRYGVLSGRMTLELRRAGEGFEYETSLRPKGLAGLLRKGEIREITTLQTTGGRVRPLDYLSVDTVARPHRRASYTFDNDSGRVTGEYKNREVDEVLRQDGHNRISAHVAIMNALHADTDIAAFSVFDRARWRDFELEAIPDQFVETPFGNFDAVEIRYASADKDKSWSLFCAPELGYVPVMIVFREDGKTKSRARLTDYRMAE